jgi:EpsI family protein
LPIVSALWLVSVNASLQEPQILLLPALLWVVALAVGGFGVARRVAFPIGFLYFAIPVWGHINGLLQSMSADVTTLMLKAVGVPATLTGNIIRIPAGAFEVAGGCSGIHYFVVGLAVATLLGEVDRDPLRRRAMLIGLMGVLAIVCNWVRVFTVVLSGQLTNMQSYLVRVDHYWFGWGLFAVVMFGFIWFASRGPRPDRPTVARAPDSQSPALRPALIAAVLVVVLPLTQWALRNVRGTGELPAQTLPSGQDGWTGPYSTAQDWRPVFHGASSEVFAAYRDQDARAVEIYSAVYLTQRQGAELIGYGNSLVGERGLQEEGESVVATPRGPMVETIVADTSGRRSIIWSSYTVGGRTFVEPLRSQLWYGLTSLGGQPVASLSAARAVCVPNCDGAREKLGRFFGQMGPRLRLGVAPVEG